MIRLTCDELKQHQTSQTWFQHSCACVFVAKYRRGVFDDQAIDVLRAIFADVCSDVYATLVQMDGEDNHVHLLVEYPPPKVAVSSLVSSLKGVSSRLLRQQRLDIRKRHWKGVLWSPGYFASSCGGAPNSIVRQYIEQQKTPGLTLMTASLSALSFPALKDGACRAFCQKSCGLCNAVLSLLAAALPHGN
jgi:putative transposase